MNNSAGCDGSLLQDPPKNRTQSWRAQSARDLGSFLWDHFLREKKLKWAKPPALDSSGHIVFDEVQVCGVDGKGVGVIAKKQLNPGLIFGYGGRVITKSEMTNRAKTLNQGRYVLEGNSDTYFDAHPRLSSRDHEKWVGSKVNEPSNGESFNCVFGNCVPRLPGEWEPHLIPCGLVLCVVRNINKGEELTALYGWSSRIYKSVGYTPSFDIPLLPRLLQSQYDKLQPEIISAIGVKRKVNEEPKNAGGRPTKKSKKPRHDVTGKFVIKK